MVTARRLLCWAGCGLVATLLLARNVKADFYIIDPAQSELVVQLFKTGIGSMFAHDHVVRATKYTGQIQLDPAAPTTTQITVEVDATALVADEPETRRKYALPLGLSEDSRREIQQTLESASQLEVQRYPTIRFRSTRVEPNRGGKYTVVGELELHGVTRTVSLSLQADLQEKVLHGKGSGRFLQSSFGYQPYRAFGGIVQNQDEVVLQIDIVAIRQ